MDVLDEKQNGTPPMEVDELVSVRDRESRSSFLYPQYQLNTDTTPKMTPLPRNICQTWDMT